jgi:hypothetical protein
MVNSEILRDLPVSPCLRLFIEILLSEADEREAENLSAGTLIFPDSSLTPKGTDPSVSILNRVKSYEVRHPASELRF